MNRHTICLTLSTILGTIGSVLLMAVPNTAVRCLGIVMTSGCSYLFLYSLFMHYLNIEPSIPVQEWSQQLASIQSSVQDIFQQVSPQQSAQLDGSEQVSPQQSSIREASQQASSQQSPVHYRSQQVSPQQSCSGTEIPSQ